MSGRLFSDGVCHGLHDGLFSRQVTVVRLAFVIPKDRISITDNAKEGIGQLPSVGEALSVDGYVQRDQLLLSVLILHLCVDKPSDLLRSGCTVGECLSIDLYAD